MKQRQITNYIVIHCSATPPDMDLGAKEITDWHKQRGFTTIGYNHVIRRDGKIEQGRPIGIQGAHVRGHNHEAEGICLIGGCKRVKGKLEPENNFTPQQEKSLKLLLKYYRHIFPTANIIGHRKLDKGKACPSFDVLKWVEENKKELGL